MLTLALAAVLSSSPGFLPDGECRFWRGRLWGNDSDVKTQLWLCRRKKQLCGTLSWSGTSGENVRSLSGEMRGHVFHLHDVEFLSSRPSGDWRFCLIDVYRLKANPRTSMLEGSYVSRACADEAALSLEPISVTDSPASCFDAPES